MSTFLLTEIVREKVDEKVADVMEKFDQSVGEVPRPLEVLAISPGLFMGQVGSIKYYRNHPTLDPILLTCIRFLAAVALDYQACREFNGNLLIKQGLTEDELAALVEDVSKAPLEPREITLLQFVIDGLNGKKVASSGDIDKLKQLGWTESDILDATNQGFNMLTHGRILEYFQA